MIRAPRSPYIILYFGRRTVPRFHTLGAYTGRSSSAHQPTNARPLPFIQQLKPPRVWGRVGRITATAPRVVPEPAIVLLKRHGAAARTNDTEKAERDIPGSSILLMERRNARERDAAVQDGRRGRRGRRKSRREIVT